MFSICTYTNIKRSVGLEVLRIDSTDTNFVNEFKEYQEKFFTLLSASFEHYYGNDYQLSRIIDGRAIVYIAMMGIEVIGASYVKRNCRRGGTVVDPRYRNKGVAGYLVGESLKDFPYQYSILRSNNVAMQLLLAKFGFMKAKSTQEINEVVNGEFSQLHDFVNEGEFITFMRTSLRRHVQRERLILVHNYAIN